jgi:hypothetical protein
MRIRQEQTMRRSMLLAVSLFASSGLAQQPEAPAVEGLTRVDGGMGGVLRLLDGTRREFHIEVTGTRARLCDKRMPGNALAEVALASAEERELLALLDAWVGATFSAEERAEALAPDQLTSPRTEEEDRWHRRASLVREVHGYQRVTRPTIDKVFAGRGTVSLSMQLRLGDDPPQQVLWRNLGDQPFARMHRGTDEAPLALDSRDEKEILLGMRYWLASRVGKVEVWEADAKETTDEVGLVLNAFRSYLMATSPRLRTSGTVMDSARGRSKMFEISDARNRITCVRFDHAAGTQTPGRLRDGENRDAPVVELGGPRERELLTMLRAAANLRRAFLREKQTDDWRLQLLDEELAAYERQFPAKK